MVTADVGRKKNNNNPAFVRVEDCRERHGVTVGRVDKIDEALFGADFRGGMVKDISDIKADLRIIKENLKGKLSGRDKAVIIGAVITAIASFAASLIVLLKG